ncbi:hypothetical protein JCM10449v2_004139 [Rhodotorula kratochvilovae]
MSHFYAQQPRPRPEPLALPQHHTSTASSEHRARLLSSLRSAPLPQQQHHQQGYQQQHQQHQYQHQHQQQQGGYSSGPTPQAQAIAEFQHAQSAYLAELQRTIESQIVAQQQLEREAAYRMLVSQGQGQGHGRGSQTPPHVTNPQYAQYAPAPHQQGPYSAGPAPGRGGPAAFAQQQQQLQQQNAAQQANNPLVASALARRQRQEQAQASQQQYHQQQRGRGSPSPAGRGPRPSHPQQQQQRGGGARENRSTPPPVHLQAKRASPPPPAVILSAPGEPYPDTSSSGSESGETRPSSPDTSLDAAKETKAARRRSHLDALAGLGHAVEQRKGGGARVRPVSVGFAGDFPRSASAGHGQRSASDSAPILSPHATSYTPLPLAPAPTSMRQAPPPVPGTASATRQPRGPPTELTDAANFATRVRARAIESLRARGRGAAVVQAAA